MRQLAFRNAFVEYYARTIQKTINMLPSLVAVLFHFVLFCCALFDFAFVAFCFHFTFCCFMIVACKFYAFESLNCCCHCCRYVPLGSHLVTFSLALTYITCEYSFKALMCMSFFYVFVKFSLTDFSFGLTQTKCLHLE